MTKRTKPQESTAREITRTYSAKRTGTVNYPNKQSDYEIALADDSEEDEDTSQRMVCFFLQKIIYNVKHLQNVVKIHRIYLQLFSECHCGQQPVIENLQAENAI